MGIHPYTIGYGLILTVSVYCIAVWVNGKIPSLLTSPMILSILMVGSVLIGFKFPYEDYYEGGKLISWFLGPAVISLAVPIKKNVAVLIKFKKAIFLGTFVGSLTAILSNFWLFYAAGFPPSLVYSIVPKHVTTPIAMELSKIMGGDPSITVGITFFTGIFGFLTVGYFLDRFSIKDPISRGLVIGVSYHGLGAVRAMEEGELTGAIGSIAFIITGTITSFLTPILLIWFKTIL
ncbi:LrgB family protein [Neobacillus citreus]|uniref:LrgB family protein n=1 Tax=Neobacillus citreus TaxID=2833578 RepID=A0A942T4V5_9BACI|nr:LrgB family protein [Neobacillus citreus]MCH6264527.1 LrgB family protein [Neobacillus citreus]